MRYKVEIREEALDDLALAAEGYENIQRGLGTRFISCWEKRMQDILNYPKIFAIKYGTIRTALIIPFPWQIIFEIDGDKIIVYQIFCAISEPSKRFKK